jgi:predicted nuclease of predicted toxin-antitoxin system
MRLLFDQNLSPRLVARLADLYPNSAHVADLGLSMADDEAVWNYARANDFMIISKDADFSELSLLRGFPPKVVWIQRGNCSTHDIEEILRSGFSAIEALDQGISVGILLLH